MAELESLTTLTPETFGRIRRLVYEKAGIDLRNGKEQMVSARLTRKLRENKCATYEDYLRGVESDRTGEQLVSLIDALTTNFTSFMRETAHFDFLRETVLPNLTDRRQIDVWCAASATGEEPYSLMFTMLDATSRCRMLATDISTRALATARQAIYPAERFSACRKDWLPKYLLRGDGDFTGLYQVKPEVSSRIDFRRLNLVEDFDPGQKFPLISCRNVMIYFDRPTQERVVSRLTMFLEPGGYLFVGHSERLVGINHSLRLVKPAIYQRTGSAEPIRGGTKLWK